MSLELAFAEMCELVGADVLEGVERTRTADPISLRGTRGCVGETSVSSAT